MKLIQSGLSITQAIKRAQELALENDKVYSVRRDRKRGSNNSVRYGVYDGMVGNAMTSSYTARPAALRAGWTGQSRR
jgi:hypothetical protein